MVEAARTLFAASFAESLQYRGSAVMWTIAGFMTQVMALSIWSSVAHARGGSVGGYSQGGLITYFLASQLVVVLTASWASWKLAEGIRTGSLSAELVKPVPPWLAWFTEIFGFKLLMLAIQVPALLLASVALGASRPTVGLSLLLALPAICATVALRFSVEMCIGSTCFWIVDPRGVSGTFFLSYMLLSGGFAPVALMPGTFRTMAEYSPFYYMLGFPVDLLTGRLTGGQLAHGFAMQGAWLAAALLLGRLLWRRGLRRFSAVGA